MLSPTNATVRVERVIHECMTRHQAASHLGMRLAYQRVFVDALRRVPRRYLPKDPLRMALTVRALEYASFAAFVEHATCEKVALHGGAIWEILDWTDECCKFWYEILHQWADLAVVKRTEERRELLQTNADWLRSAVADIRENGIERDKPLHMSTSWFRQIENICVLIATFWLSEEPEIALRERLEQDAYELHEFQYLYNLPAEGDDTPGM